MLTNTWLIEKLDSVDSTQSQSKSRHRNGQKVLFAKEQRSGYGQKNRPWISFCGNLTATLSFPCHAVNYHEITLVALIALGKILNKLQPNLPYQYKWVNDLLLEGKKLAGILCESQKDRIFLGLGVNLLKSPDEILSTNLNDYDLVISPEEFLTLFIESFTAEFNSWLVTGFTQVAKAWKARAYKMGQEVIIKKTTGEERSGKLVDLDKSGLILLEEGKKISYLNCTLLM